VHGLEKNSPAPHDTNRQTVAASVRGVARPT